MSRRHVNHQKQQRQRPESNRRVQMQWFRGVIRINPKGFGFVTLADSQEEIFVRQADMNGALADDEVLVEILPKLDARGRSGVIRQILSRAHSSFVACLDFGSEGFVVRPLRRELPAVIKCRSNAVLEDMKGAQIGDWVQAELVDKNATCQDDLLAEVVSAIGKAGNVTHDLNAVAKEYELPKKYTPAQERRFGQIAPIEVPRTDYTHLTAVTIDPTDAKDFDDALSYESVPHRRQAVIGVHIADVACYIPPDGALDKCARERGFTCYLPGRTIPMLPAVLSTDLCSLNEGVERLAHSVFITVSTLTGEVLGYRREHTKIRVTKRLTHEEASRAVSGEKTTLPAAIVQLLVRLNKVATVMRKYREETEDFLPIAVREYRVLCGGRPLKVQDVVKYEPNPASDLVEDFMLCANSYVAREMQEKGIPSLFRNHGEPDMESLEIFRSTVVAVLGKKRGRFSASRHGLVSFLRTLGELGTSGELLSVAFLRCLPRAEYGTDCLGHFGLGKSMYCHFTSPIRRYPDLLVHQQLLLFDLGRKVRPHAFMFQQAACVNGLEQLVDKAYFSALDRLKLRYLESRRIDDPQQSYEAFIMRATSDGLQVFLPQVGLMGMMDRLAFGDERWQYDYRTESMVSSSGQAFRCGNVIYVQVKSVDVIHDELRLRPVQMSFSF